MPARVAGIIGAWVLLAFARAVGASPVEAALANDRDGENWAAYGRTHSERHASPLTQIATGNVARLGLAWSLELPDVNNGATEPLAVDGTLYFTAGQSLVHAVDAASGKLLWRFDPEVAKVAGRKLRYGWGPRGIAFWNGKVYVGTTDGRLIAIDARTGRQVWSQLTVDPEDERIITGAPRVFDGKVIIGHGGADMGPIRGYVTTYDAETGRQLWRFHVVPGNPADGFENDAMRMAARTWTGEWWKYGGGGTVWNAMTYDPELDLVYLGTGNGAPWNRKIRSPGGGDNLFLCSVVALDADTGEYRWHYQTTPGETWDYNSVMDITLATLTLEGAPRKVILHAPKNGFFYVIDRESGKLISAEKLGTVTWAERIDLTTGRPVETPGARYEKKGVFIAPSSAGMHNWQPMSFSEKLGLVFIPVQDTLAWFTDEGMDLTSWRHQPGRMNPGIDLMAMPPAPPPELLQRGPATNPTALIAWDPVRQREAWRVNTPGAWNPGTLVTDGNLVFQGRAGGQFVAYDAATGRQLWSFDAKMGIGGTPITYSVNGRQQVSVLAGWGAVAAALMGPAVAEHGWQARVHPHRLLTFVLDGKARLPPTPPPMRAVPLDDSDFVVDPSRAREGASLYHRTCSGCHGMLAVAGGYAPDLRASPIPLSPETFNEVVRNGSLELRGMPRYGELSDRDLEGLRHYLRATAREAL